jgi:hypothetical protein
MTQLRSGGTGQAPVDDASQMARWEEAMSEATARLESALEGIGH